MLWTFEASSQVHYYIYNSFFGLLNIFHIIKGGKKRVVYMLFSLIIKSHWIVVLEKYNNVTQENTQCIWKS
jgi:hypothetical protein